MAPISKANTMWTLLRKFTLLFFLAASLGQLAYGIVQRSSRLETNSQPYSRSISEAFDWYALQPSDDINWTDCFGDQKCARLNLPLDHASPEGPKTQIALQMKPATNTTDYKGTVILGPGSGGSGTDFIQTMGDMVVSVLGPNFDILAFDRRGTGATTPLALCFDSDSQLAVWNLQDVTSLNVSDGSIPFARAHENVVGERCLGALGGNGKEDLNGTAEEWGLGRFMDTASLATDMLRIVEKLGQEKLQFAGFSFGSVLGQYFAAMYPDKVGRLMVDGVYDATNYRATLWNSNLDSTDAVIASFYSFCHQGGPSNCPIYEPTIDKIKARVDHIIHDLTPFSVPFASQGPAVVTTAILEDLLVSSIYTPVALFPMLADVLVAVENNNQTILSQFVDNFVSYKCNCNDPSPWLRQTQDSQAINCSDGDPVLDTPAEYDAYLENLSRKSAVAAPFWARKRLQCAEWKIRAKSRYTGPLSGNTSFPILFVSAAFDPVTPLDNAQAVQKRYPGSGLLVQNSYGHTASIVPSNCTALAQRAYFTHGVLPKAGTVCQPNMLPFIDQ